METEPKYLENMLVGAPLVVWLSVWSHVHLALKHPENRGPGRDLALQFWLALARRLVEQGILPQSLQEQSAAMVTPVGELHHEA